ncbi:hypothetical protein ACIO8G_02345 [Streptomyces sp. NPDC087219]|uniref:hypothetical protein n=1 Tax=Streptomyces sp. NPDC087219 TaxID=3365770 RepID=UPI0037FDA090
MLPLLLCFLPLMYAVAVRTAGRRVVPAPGRAWPWTAVPIAAAVLPVVVALLLVQAVATAVTLELVTRGRLVRAEP